MKSTVQINTSLTDPKFCFSYVRFSSDAQADGSSLDRQNPIAARVAAQMGWILKPEWNAADLGVSAFKGDNLKTLESIIASVGSKIPVGSVCIIEAWDRFSRADLDTAEDTLKKALRAGLEIYIDRGGHHLTRESINKPIDRIVALLELAASNEFSAKLSERVKKAYAFKREKILNGETIKTKRSPGWINGETWALNEHAKTIAAIFDLYLSGMGPAAIARKFNAEKVSSLGGGSWAQPVVYRLLSDRRVIGEIEINGQVREGYYPEAITKDTFSRVQSKLNDNRAKRPTGTGSSGKIVNLLAGLGYCSCGSLLKVVNGFKGKFVTCYGRLNGLGCTARMQLYEPFEAAFLHTLRFNPAQLLNNDNGESINAETQILKGRLAETEKQIANITEALTVAVTKALVQRQAELEQQAEEIKRQIELVAAKKVTASGSVERLAEICLQLRNVKTDQAVRVKVQAWIRENINRVTLDRVSKEFTVELKNGNLITMDLNCNLKGQKSVESLIGLNRNASVAAPAPVYAQA